MTTPPNLPSKKKGPGCLIGLTITGVLGLILCLLVVIILIPSSGGFGYVEPKTPMRRVMIEKTDSDDMIARIDLEGVISSTIGGGGAGANMVEAIQRKFEEAVADDDVKAIVFRINSPGGEVTASDTIYRAVQKANAKKPVVVYMDSVAASGGYYAACGAQYIIANETTLTGSIGVIISSINYRELIQKVGVEMKVFKSGRFKDMLSGSREMSQEERDYVQKLVMDMYDKFVGIVSKARGVPVKELKGGVADGRVVSGADALKAKLVDQTGYIEDAYAKARQLGKSSNAQIVKFEGSPSFLDLMGVLGKAETEPPKIELDLSSRILPPIEPGKLYMLPFHFVE